MLYGEHKVADIRQCHLKDIKYLQTLWFIRSAELQQPKCYFIIKEILGQQDLRNEYYSRQLELHFEDTSKVNLNCTKEGIMVSDTSHRRNFEKPLSVYFNKGNMINFISLYCFLSLQYFNYISVFQLIALN